MPPAAGSTPPAALATVHLWTVPPRAVPASLHAMGARAWQRSTLGLRFAKLAGTADGFSLAGPRLTRWFAVCAWADTRSAALFEQTDYARRWRRRAVETLRLDLRPLAARGRWSGAEPFGSLPPPGPDAGAAGGPVAALTRARLAPAGELRFWRTIPTVAAELDALDPARGPLLRLGVSECPLIMQGTFSVWRTGADLAAFAYRSAAHRRAIADTAAAGWYAEELFSRFEVLAAHGTLDGLDPLAALRPLPGAGHVQDETTIRP